MNITPKQIIAALGGPPKVAALLGPECSRQRVEHWARNGFPARVQLDHAALLRKGEVKARRLARKG